MQKSGGAVIHMKGFEIEIMFGIIDPEVAPQKPFSDAVISFLDAWSKTIRQNMQAKGYPDIVTFAFWIRKANVMK